MMLMEFIGTRCMSIGYLATLSGQVFDLTVQEFFKYSVYSPNYGDRNARNLVSVVTSANRN